MDVHCTWKGYVSKFCQVCYFFLPFLLYFPQISSSVVKITAQSRLVPSRVPSAVRLGSRRLGLEIMWPSSTQIRACSRRWYAPCVRPTLLVIPTTSPMTFRPTSPWSTGLSETRRYPFLHVMCWGGFVPPIPQIYNFAHIETQWMGPGMRVYHIRVCVCSYMYVHVHVHVAQGV